MAVLDCKETYRDRGGTEEEDCSVTLERSWDVWCDDLGTTYSQVLAAEDDNGQPLPVRGDEHPEFDGAYCVRVRARQDAENGVRWLVTAEYNTAAKGVGESCNPLLEPPDVEWDPVEYRVPVERADFLTNAGVLVVPNVAVTNSAGDPFEPPHERDEGRLTVAITRNEVGYDTAQAEAFANALNSAAWYGFAPYTCKMRPVRARRFYWRGLKFFKKTYVIDIKDETWDLFAIDRGHRENVNGELREIFDPAGLGPSSAYPLDGLGRVQAVNPGTPPQAVYLRYRIYQKAQNFNVLDLPDPTE